MRVEMEPTSVERLRQAVLDLLQAIEELAAPPGDIRGQEGGGQKEQPSGVSERRDDDGIIDFELESSKASLETWLFNDGIPMLPETEISAQERGKQVIEAEQTSSSGRVKADDLLAIAEYLAYDVEARPMGRINWKRFSEKRPDRSNKAWASVYQRYMSDIEGTVSTVGGLARANLPLGKVLKGGPVLQASNPFQRVRAISLSCHQW
ncbi:hypothetical protein CALVIDRAFT_530348 [Calocera viscosa TUFC12733]|uniref:Uncharacterized protein n=1 Tax=Calocera viscosa (strain TUFC12733) TaxID=1330018 RepID=A0A167I2B6_CALVF|nr:hypothetical protein CALVIDRAFT_530348 [Calocera viscosa TUFC12733]